MDILKHFLLFSLFPWAGPWAVAQSEAGGAPPYDKVDEGRIIGSQWKYTYALDLESNRTIHRAGDEYDFYLYFKADHSYEQYLEGSISRGDWSLDGCALSYHFKRIEQFWIAELSKERLVLEFTPSNSAGAYQYYFIPVSGSGSPFSVPANELPLVDVDGTVPGGADNGTPLAEQQGGSGEENGEAKSEKDKSRDNRPNINIELSGGGFYGGIDPVLRDYVQINSSGRLIKEFQSVNNGLVVTKRDIPQEDLEVFAGFVAQKGFFEMERIYDCKTERCSKRKKEKPMPMPLRISVVYGDREKNVTVTIWGRDRNGTQYVEYPEELEQIVTSLREMTHR